MGSFSVLPIGVFFAVLVAIGSIILFACYLGVIMMSRFHELARQE